MIEVKMKHPFLHLFYKIFLGEFVRFMYIWDLCFYYLWEVLKFNRYKYKYKYKKYKYEKRYKNNLQIVD